MYYLTYVRLRFPQYIMMLALCMCMPIFTMYNTTEHATHMFFCGDNRNISNTLQLCGMYAGGAIMATGAIMSYYLDPEAFYHQTMLAYHLYNESNDLNYAYHPDIVYDDYASIGGYYDTLADYCSTISQAITSSSTYRRITQLFSCA